MIRRWIGKLIFKVVRAAGKCLAAYLISIIMERSNEIMATNNKVTFWGALGQIVLAAGCSYGMAKMGDQETSWVPYRNQMMANMAGTAFNFLGQQMQAQATTEQQTTEAAAQ